MPEFSGLVDHPTPRPYPFGPTTIATILDAGLAEHPNRIALVDGERTWTWSELDVAVGDVASGITPGELRWWSLGNCAEQVIAVLATFRAGAVWVAAPWKDPSEHVPALTDRLGPITLVDANPPADDSVKPQISDRHAAPHGSGSPVVDPHTPAAVMFTSGTTGQPKAVAHSQHNLLGPGLVSIELEPPRAGERIGTPLDLGNANIAVLGPISALLRGSTFVVLANRWAPALAADIATYSVTRLFAVPTLAFDLTESAEVSVAQLRSLDRVILGGSGADPEVLRRFAERFGVRPTLSYGMSEAPTGIVRESLDDPIGSGRGFPLPHVEIEILGASGDRLGRGADGEVCVRPASSGAWAHTWTGTLGYVGEPERSDELFRDGVLHTGDRGHLDADGALHVTGRLSDMIIRGGKNVDPLEVEEALRRHPGVLDALVYGVRDERLGQRVIAKIVPSPVVDRDKPLATPSRLQIHVRSSVDQHLDSVEIVSQLPRNEMGKVIRGG